MRQHKTRIFCMGWALCLTLALAAAAPAATSFSNSLTGFTGNSTEVATQTAVGAEGFNFSSTDGFIEDSYWTRDQTAVFDSSGAHFGTLIGGDGGRNYLRTNESDYATVSFVAQVTVTVNWVTPADGTTVFFGMGTASTNKYLYWVPDWSSQYSSTFVGPYLGKLTTWRSANDVNEWSDTDQPGLTAGTGTHRLQMSFDPTAKTMTYAVDKDYSGGPFSADYTLPPVDLNHINCPSGCGGTDADFFAANGWPTEPSSIYFGGDDVAIFKDFSVTVSAPGTPGDYNNNGKVDAADYVLWRNGGPLLNDPNPGNPTAQYNLWKANFGKPPGAASGSALAAVPEPASLVLFVIGLTAFQVKRQRRGR